MRQVTHALLTRPPLSHSSVRKLHSASFDLHVLSTPPAFILSQDQTLMFKYDCLKLFQNNTWLFFRFVLLSFPTLRIGKGLNFVLNEPSFQMLYSLKNFKDLHMFFKELACFILFSYQCSFRLLSVAHASALLDYHVFQSLSTTFFYFFQNLLY